MEPTNQPARRNAINRFIGLSVLSVIVVVLGVYFLFNTPAGLFKNEIKMYKFSEEEHGQLLTKVDGMTSNLKNIAQADQSYLNSNNEIEKGTLQSNLQEYQRTILDGLLGIKNDSSKLSSWLARKDAYNYISTFNALIAYRNTIAYLQKSLQEKGGAATELLKAKSMLDQCTAQLEIYKAMAASKPAPQVPAGGGGGGGAKEAQLQQQLEKVQADLAACVKAKSGTVVPIPTPTVNTNFDESKKATTLFDAGQELYSKAEGTKNLIERRGMLISIKQLFEKSKVSHPEPDKVTKVIIQIDAELKKLSNMG